MKDKQIQRGTVRRIYYKGWKDIQCDYKKYTAIEIYKETQERLEEKQREIEKDYYKDIQRIERKSEFQTQGNKEVHLDIIM